MSHNVIGINFLMCTTYKLHIVVYMSFQINEFLKFVWLIIAIYILKL